MDFFLFLTVTRVETLKSAISIKEVITPILRRIVIFDQAVDVEKYYVPEDITIHTCTQRLTPLLLTSS